MMSSEKVSDQKQVRAGTLGLRFPLQWKWAKDGPRIDPRPREEYMADVRARWRNEELEEMYYLMEKYPDEAREWIESLNTRPTANND